MKTYYTDVALEDLKNNSVCVRTSSGIREIKDFDDIRMENMVFVNNISATNEDLTILPKGSLCRCLPINVCVRCHG